MEQIITIVWTTLIIGIMIVGALRGTWLFLREHGLLMGLVYGVRNFAAMGLFFILMCFWVVIFFGILAVLGLPGVF